jgi:hypothetical protein
MTKLMVAFRNSTNAPKNHGKLQLSRSDTRLDGSTVLNVAPLTGFPPQHGNRNVRGIRFNTVSKQEINLANYWKISTTFTKQLGSSASQKFSDP